MKFNLDDKLKTAGKYLQEHNTAVVRVLLDLLFLMVITGLLARQYIGKTYDLEIGDISTEHIRSPKDFEYVLEKETSLLFETKKNEIPPVFVCNLKPMNTAIEDIGKFFDAINSYKKDITYLNRDGIHRIIRLLPDKYSSMMSKANLSVLVQYNNINRLQFRTEKLLRELYIAGILRKDNPLESVIRKNGLIMHYINNEIDLNDRARKYSQVYLYEDLYHNIFWEAKKIIPELRKDKIEAVVGLVKLYLNVNLEFDKDLTEEKINEELKKLKPYTDRIK